MGDKPIPDHTDDAPSSETLHETVLDDGRTVHSRFEPGDLVRWPGFGCLLIVDVCSHDGRACYGFKIIGGTGGVRGCLSVDYADRLWTLIEGGES